MAVGNAGWFFFLRDFRAAHQAKRRLNSITSIFFFVFMFASSMFYPLDHLPVWFRIAALANPITWQIDSSVTRPLSRKSPTLFIESAAFLIFALLSFLTLSIAYKDRNNLFRIKSVWKFLQRLTYPSLHPKKSASAANTVPSRKSFVTPAATNGCRSFITTNPVRPAFPKNPQRISAFPAASPPRKTFERSARHPQNPPALL